MFRHYFVGLIAILGLTSCGDIDPLSELRPQPDRDTTASTTSSVISSSKSTVTSDGIDQATLTIQLKDQNGDNLKGGNHDLNLTAEPNHGTISSLVSNDDGTYTATFTSYGTGDITLTPTINGAPFDNPLTITREAKSGFYIDANEVTIRCDRATDGDTARLKRPGKQETTYAKRNQITPANAVSACISGIQDLKDAFRGSDFDEDISHWDTSNVTNMNGMFYGASNFNQAINNWNTSKVTDMADMFSGATSFNADISGWDTGAVTEMFYMFSGATDFKQDLSGWCVKSVTDSTDFDLNTNNSWSSDAKPDFNGSGSCAP